VPLALLHAGGWDEMILVGVALLAGVAIVFYTGRKRPADEDDEEAEPDAEPADEPAAAPDGPAPSRDAP